MRRRYEDLLQRLQDPDPMEVDKAFDAILFDRESAVPDLLEALGSGSMPSGVRYLVVQLLGFSGSVTALEAVESALEDSSPMVRAEACRSLVDLRARDSIPLLRARLEDMDRSVRTAAVEALAALTR